MVINGLLMVMNMNGHPVGRFNPSEKYYIVSWDDEIPNIWGKHNPVMFQTTNQNQSSNINDINQVVFPSIFRCRVVHRQVGFLILGRSPTEEKGCISSRNGALLP